MESKNLMEYLSESMQGKVTNMQNPTCLNCNECCSIQTIITREEYEKLSQYFKEDSEGKLIFKNATNRIKRAFRNNTIYLVCPFSDEQTKKCRIYDKRPKMCKIFHCNPDSVKISDAVKEEIMKEDGHKQLKHLFEDSLKSSPALYHAYFNILV